MIETYAKSKAVEAKNGPVLTAISKDYSIYSQVYPGFIPHSNAIQKTSERRR